MSESPNAGAAPNSDSGVNQSVRMVEWGYEWTIHKSSLLQTEKTPQSCETQQHPARRSIS
jgi:hypothetical protein